MSKNGNDDGFFAGFIIGGLAGAALALLMAPQPGEQTRARLKGRGADLKSRAGEWSEGIKQQADLPPSKVQDLSAEAKKKAAIAREEARKKAAIAREEARKKAAIAREEARKKAAIVREEARKQAEQARAKAEALREKGRARLEEQRIELKETVEEAEEIVAETLEELTTEQEEVQ